MNHLEPKLASISTRETIRNLRPRRF